MNKKIIIGIVLLLIILLIFYGCVNQSNLIGEAKNGLGKGIGGIGKVKPQCNDGLDNDGDGYCDFSTKRCKDGSTPGDGDCESKEDNNESPLLSGCTVPPVLTLPLEKTTYKKGDNLKLEIVVENPTCSTPLDLYTAIKDPEGNVGFGVKDSSGNVSFTSKDPLPFKENWVPPEYWSEVVLDAEINEDLRPGDYSFSAVFALHGVQEPFGDPTEVSFTYIYVPFDEDVSVTIDAAVNKGPIKYLHGFVAGVSAMPVTPDLVALVKAVKPSFWRFGLPPDSYSADYDLAKQLNTEIMTGASDQFGWAFGRDAKPWEIQPGCTEEWECFEKVLRIILNTVNTVKDEKPVDYFDVWNEPDGTWPGWPDTLPQFFEATRRVYNIKNEIVPELKFTVGQTAGFSPIPNFWQKYFDYLVANNIEIDAVSWHEFGRPEHIPEHVAEMRQILANYPQLGNPEIQIPEFSSIESRLIPGWRAAYLYYLEEAGVDWASLVCGHDIDKDGNEYSECEYGLDGLLDKTGTIPQHIYWVHAAYAEMTGNRIRSETTAPKNLVTLASRNDAKKEIRLLMGRYSCGMNFNWCTFIGHFYHPDEKTPPVDVTLTIKNYPYGGDTATVEGGRIPNEGIPGQLPGGPVDVATATLPVVNGTITIPLTGYRDGDAYVIRISP